MSSSETRPAASLERSAHAGRGRWCWPALGIGLALALDAVWPLAPGDGALKPRWLDLAALATLASALLGSRRARLARWATPLDGTIASGLVLAVLHVVRLQGAADPVEGLRQITAAGLCYYGLGAGLRREPAMPGSAWPALAVLSLALSAYAIGWAMQGAPAFRSACLRLDLNWLSRFGLLKSLVATTLLCLGRASERGARAPWRLTALLGALACVLCLSTGGAGLSVTSLAGLDEPFYFATSIVAVLLLASLSHMAWQLAHERPQEAGRWWGATLMFPLVAGLLLFGGATGGEGVCAIVALAGATVIAARLAPRAVARRPAAREAAETPVVRAA